jgi:2-oxoglutarate dehydrogenase E1 component
MDGSTIVPTGVNAETVKNVGHKIAVVPEGFNINPKMVGQLARRAKMGDGSLPLDWAFAEAMAFGSLVLDGTRVRLSGQDSGRGTFSQRHAVLHDYATGKTHTPLQHLSPNQAPVEILNSPLSETGVLGFEYGYSLDWPDGLVGWEAQFGDFESAQTIIDQYIAASEDKGNKHHGSCLLPQL